MDITRDKLEKMGLFKITGSANPTCFMNQKMKDAGFFIGQDKNEKWYVYGDDGDCSNREKEIFSVKDVVFNLIRESINYGKRIRSKEIKKLIYCER